MTLSKIASFLLILFLLTAGPSAGVFAETASDQSKLENIDSLKAKVREKPEDASAHAMLGNAYNSVDDYPRAIEEFKKALELDPDYSYALQQLGQVLYFAKEYEEACLALEKYLTRYGLKDLTPQDQAILWVMLGMSRYHIYYGKTRSFGDLGLAEGAFLKAIELNPQDKDAYYGLSFVYLHRKWPVHLLWYAEKALELGETDNAAALEQNINAMMDSVAHGSIEAQSPQDLVASSKDMSDDELKASGITQDNPAWSALEAAIAGFDKYDREKNEKQLSRVIDQYPDFAPAIYDRGLLVLNRGRPEEAVPDFNKAITLAPRWGRAHAGLASSYIYLKNYRSARLELKEAKALSPDNPLIQFNERLMMLFDEAVLGYQTSDLKRILKFVSEEKDKRIIEKTIFSLTIFNPAKNVDPTSFEIQELMGDIAARHPAYTNTAVSYYEKAIQLGADPGRINAKLEALKKKK